ncbi:hypothetical protein [Reyranella sp. CPCC 100927]|uniref:hypothetical protein n=1 Tax=Reyranella sp. CPCC 100927 TaxID=2599616 RepID=UPI0011B678BE|nr:hypothetical protein [Reyranella sp. CPCC 100927]TWS95134.1 hypothetical protein FQU96_40545 [Reyranella sp. CPCC 100927]
MRVGIPDINARATLNAIIVGGGPAGLGVLVAAARSNRLFDLLASGLVVLDRGPVLGSGAIGRYAINSDSFADSFLRGVDGGPLRDMAALVRHPATRALDAARGQPVPLRLAAAFLAQLASGVRHLAATAGWQPFLDGVDATSAHALPDGRWRVQCRRLADGHGFSLITRFLVLATGAAQSIAGLHDQTVAGLPLLPTFRRTLMLASTLLGEGGPRRVAWRLAPVPQPRIAIVGGSHSALAAARRLLDMPLAWSEPSITLLHRRALRITYASPEEALADGFSAFGRDDICPRTGRVFPLAGFRAEARTLLRQIWGLGNSPPERRVRLLHLAAPSQAAAADVLRAADLVVAATGYRPRALPLFDARGARVVLQSEGTGAPPMVDGSSCVLDAAGCPVPGVLGIGLAAGLPLAGTFGERSFTGQANGLALWHSDIGAAIATTLLHGAQVQAMHTP